MKKKRKIILVLAVLTITFIVIAEKHVHAESNRAFSENRFNIDKSLRTNHHKKWKLDEKARSGTSSEGDRWKLDEKLRSNSDEESFYYDPVDIEK